MVASTHPHKERIMNMIMALCDPISFLAGTRRRAESSMFPTLVTRTNLLTFILVAISTFVGLSAQVYVANQRNTHGGPGGEHFISVIDTSIDEGEVIDSIDFLENVPGLLPLLSPGRLAFVPDGTRLYVTTGSGPVAVIDTALNEVVDRIEMLSSSWVAAHGAQVYATNDDQGTVSIIDADPNSPTYHDTTIITLTETPEGLAVIPRGIAVGPDRKLYVANVNGNLIHVVNLVTGSEDVVSVGKVPLFLALTPNGERAYVTNAGADDSRDISVIDIAPMATFREHLMLGGNPHPQGIAITPNGTRAYISAANGYVYVLSIDVNNPDFHDIIGVISVGGDLPYIAIRRDGRRAYTTAITRGKVAVIDTDPNSSYYNTVLKEITVGASPNGVAIAPPPTYSCSGFDPPMASGPVTVKKNRVLPLKAELLDGGGNAITDLDVASPPVIQVLFDSGMGGDPVDVTDQALPAGQGTEGNQFVFSDGKWHFNLKTKNYTAVGTYTISMVSGDDSEYTVDSCVAEFVINP